MSFGYSNFKKACRLSLRGRATRSEFWSFSCFALLYDLAFLGIAIFCWQFFGKQLGLIAFAVVSIATLVLSVFFACTMVRRLHDTGKSGYYALAYYVLAFVTTFLDKIDESSIVTIVISLIQLVYFIVILVFMCTKSDPVPNKYGDPEQ